MSSIVRLLIFSFALFSAHSSSAQLTLNSINIPDKIEEGYPQFYSISKDGEDHSEYYSCTWDFGDGNKMVYHNQFEMKHTFRDDGNYTINFHVKDSKNREVSISQQVKVVNLPPELRFLDGKVEDSNNGRVKFEAIAYDPGSDDLTYHWDFGDGASSEGLQSRDVFHTYDAPGVYTVRVTVDDGDGGSDYKEMSISVETDWHATISGDYNFELSGGAGLMYQTRIDTITKEVLSCFKMFTFYDDNNNSFLNVGSNTYKRLAGEKHSLGGSHRDNFKVIMHHGMKKSLYANMSSRFRMQEVQEDYNSIVGKSFQSLSLLSDMREAAKTGENLYGIQFEEVSGSIDIEPIKGNKLEGRMTALLEGTVHGPDGKSVKKQIHIDLVFNVRVNDVAKYNMENGCEEVADPFFVTDYSPRDGKVNVSTEKPCLEVEFSEPVDPLSITNSSIIMGYYKPNNVFVPEFHEVKVLDNNHNRVKLVPTRPLRHGVKYEVFVYSGDRGVRSLEGGELAEDEHWSFSTQIVPSDYKIRVYQTLADAPLVEDKETMVRFEMNWDRPKDVHEKSLVDEFPATVKLKTKSGIDICKSVIFKHQDLYSKLDTTLAKNSINIFDWRPLELDGNKIFIEVIPDFQKCVNDDEKVVFEYQKKIEHSGIRSKLKLEYYYIKTTKDEVLENDLKNKMFKFVERNDRFSQMIYPIYQIKSRYIDEIYLEGEGIFNEIAKSAYEKIVLESSADLVVFFYTIPEGDPGATFRTEKVSSNFKIKEGKEFIVIRIDEEMVDKHLERPTLSHEIGHSFYLEHIPFIPNGKGAGARREKYGDLPLNHWEDHENHEHIEGFKIGKNGRYAFNKSCSEGNAEADGIITYMFPNLRNINYKTAWINHTQFNYVIDQIKKSKKGLTFNVIENQNMQNWASINDHSPLNKMKTLMVAGTLDKKDNKVNIRSLIIQDDIRNFSQEPGPLTIQALDENDKVISKETFDPEPKIVSCYPPSSSDEILFSASLEIPVSQNVASIQVLDKNNVIGEYLVSKHKPNIELLSPSSNDTISEAIELTWQASDIDHDDLLYSIYYTSGDLNDWRMKGITQKQKLKINLSELSSGPSPTFKVVASDGYHESEAIVPVHIDFPFNIDWMTPTDTADVTDEIKITFSNAVMPSADANQWFRFLGRDSIGIISKIPYEVEYAEDYTSITLIPHHELDPTLDYRVSYGLKPPKPVAEDVDNSKNQPKKRKRPLKDFLAKQVDKMTADDENEENGNFLKDVLGLPTKEVPKKEEVVEEKRSGLADILGLNEEVEKEVFIIKDVFGNELGGYYSTPFRIYE